MEDVICQSPALVPSWTETLLFGSFLCGSLFPPLSGFPGRRAAVGEHTQRVREPLALIP